MLGTIVRKEFLERLISFRFFLATALCVVLLPGLVYVRSQEYATRARTYPKTVESHRRDVQRLPREFSWAIFGRVMGRPLNTLSVLVDPVDLRDGGDIELMWRTMPKHSRAAGSNPVPHLFPGFSVLTFVTIAMSLLAVVFSFDAVCGEKGRGTLKLILANAVPRGTLLAGKWLGGLVALILPFTVGGLLSATILLVTMSGHFTSTQWVAMAVMFLISLLYLSVTFAAGMLVSSLTTSPATSAAWLLLLWSVAFLAYPSLAPVGAAWLAPTPSRGAYDEDVRAQQGQVLDRTYKEWQEFMAQHPNIQEEDNAGWWISQRERYLDEMKLLAQRVEALHEKYARRLDNQVEVASNMLRATPLGSYALAVHELAGAGPTERARLLVAVARYRNAFFVYFANRSLEMFQERKAKGLPQVPPYTTGDFPLFEYYESTAADRVSHSLLDVVLLVAWNAVLFLAAYARFARYDVS